MFLKRQITLFSVTRIPVRVDGRWLIVLALMTGITAFSLHPLVNNGVGSIFLAFIATLLFFVSIFLHEFAHAVVARMEGLEVMEIVLHPFGVLARFRQPPETPRAEFRIAIAGPAASLLVSLAFVLMIAGSRYIGTDILTLLLFLLALTNFLIAVFNLFPGYPLDGGRVLRAYLWKQGKDLNEATQLTGRCGQAIGIGLIIVGLVFGIGRGEYFTGFWAVLVGVFLLDSATSIVRETQSEAFLRVETIMSLPAVVEASLTLQRFVDEILPMHRRTAFAVAASGRFAGILVLDDLKKIARESWRTRAIKDIMWPVSQELFVHIDSSVADARELIESNRAGAVAVLNDAGNIVGVVHLGSISSRK
jgi:Zn-dependent protease